jgi:hypothetical protein
MRVNFDRAPNCYYSERTKINFLQRLIIVHSILYYELDAQVISDKDFDELAKQLVEMSKEFSSVEETQYYYVLHDFDGTTGFDINSRLSEKDRLHVTKIANQVLRCYGGNEC